ncbi:MAG: class I SAM-dependent methyltransferase, partial [Verrucomicrobiota bacterium]|nr:class I SAM-dependent methyltransferase [Verrucomicrobiota bacterium]
DTKRIVAALWPAGGPKEKTELLELGCGPGFYSCGIAQRFPQVFVIGVDRAARQLEFASEKARTLGLTNCRFLRDNVLDLSHSDESFDVVIAARLFTILPDPRRAIAEMFRTLKSGGRCLVAEPRYAFWASIPLFIMWLAARLTGARNAFCEPRKANVLELPAFEEAFTSQPWRSVKVWRDGRYQYALCEKR